MVILNQACKLNAQFEKEFETRDLLQEMGPGLGLGAPEVKA